MDTLLFYNPKYDIDVIGNENGEVIERQRKDTKYADPVYLPPGTMNWIVGGNERMEIFLNLKLYVTRYGHFFRCAYHDKKWYLSQLT